MFHENRLSGHAMENLSSLALTDIVNGMTARASGVITTLQSAMSGDGIELDQNSIINPLASVYLEIEDVKNIVQHFYKTQIQTIS